MKVGLYKNTRPGISGIYNRIIRWWERGPYSHCELIFSDGMAASSSFEDGGVRFKRIEFNPDHWDFIELPMYLEPRARQWFDSNCGKHYDIAGNIRFLFGFAPDDSDKYFCSEAVAESLGIFEPWRLGPNGLAAVLRFYKDNQ